jgi:hypothetical protein
MGPLNIIKPKKYFFLFFLSLSHCTRFDEISLNPDEINEPRRSTVPRRSRAHLDLMRRGQLVSKDAHPKEKKNSLQRVCIISIHCIRGIYVRRVDTKRIGRSRAACLAA